MSHKLVKASVKVVAPKVRCKSCKESYSASGVVGKHVKKHGVCPSCSWRLN